jgi:predicted MPP superfamily phosphohydrolase
MAIALFYISLILVIVMLTIKSFGIYIFSHNFFKKIAKKSDIFFHNFGKVLRYWITKIKFKNFHKLIVLVISFSKREIIYLKRRFDSKQPKFFLKSQKPNSTNKNSVSFFLKNVSEYKESLRKKDLS